MTERVLIRRASSTRDAEENGPAWRPWSDEEERTGATAAESTPEGEKLPQAVLACANGHLSTIRNHTIAADGTVSPSLLCYVKDCGWHVFGRLEGWARDA
jgi:hypothetical protein